MVKETALDTVAYPCSGRCKHATRAALAGSLPGGLCWEAAKDAAAWRCTALNAGWWLRDAAAPDSDACRHCPDKHVRHRLSSATHLENIAAFALVSLQATLFCQALCTRCTLSGRACLALVFYGSERNFSETNLVGRSSALRIWPFEKNT